MNELRLRVIRESLNMTQRDVSGKLDIAQAHYWKWEKGLSSPNAKQILQLCEIFKCTPNDLFGFKGDYLVTMDNLDQD